MEHFACESERLQGCRWCGPVPDTCITCTEGFRLNDQQKCDRNPIECENNEVLYQGVCQKECPPWTFKSKSENGTTNTCEDCAPTCKSCSGPGENACESCRASKYLSTDTSGNKFCCRPGFFGLIDSAETGCSPCGSNCAECSSAIECTQCQSPFVLLANGECSALCDAGYFVDLPKAKCSKCDASCSSCDGSSNEDCTSCADATHFLYKGTCAAECPPDTAASNAVCLEPFAPLDQPEPFCDPVLCPESYRGDGECDLNCDTELCGDDRGDCSLDTNAAYCNTYVSCSSCQGAAGCGWCPSSQLCQNYTYSHEHDVVEVDSCSLPLMIAGCLMHPFEDDIAVVGSFSDSLNASVGATEWIAGEVQTLQWGGGERPRSSYFALSCRRR